MNTDILKAIEGKQMKKRPDVRVGDNVKLHMKIKEGEKERIQVFEGTVLALKNSGLSQTITVRKISSGIGVDRIVPVHSPLLEKIEITKRGNVRRSKLYYMKRKVGKRALRVNNVEDVYMTDEVEVKPEVDSQEVSEVVSEAKSE